MERALSKVEGIKNIDASNKTRLVKIEIADASKFDVSKAIEAIKAGTGWDATKK